MSEAFNALSGILGVSDAIEEVKVAAIDVSPTDARVLLCGETGTGKNLVAKAIHELHPQRRERRFRRTNVGALVPELAASQLFGHKAGAFTNAVADHDGIIVEADGGSLFLDEISTASATVQVMLLTLSETRRVNPVGGGPKDGRGVDIRVISATTKTLEELRDDGELRQDLFYRLAEFVIELPPLRRRRGDIPILAKHFLKSACKELRKDIDRGSSALMGLESAATKKLKDEYHWPGNVRELDHVIRAAVVRSRAEPGCGELRAGWIKLPRSSPAEMAVREVDHELRFNDRVERFKELLCREALYRTGGNRTAAARQLGIDVKTVKKYGDGYAASSPT